MDFTSAASSEWSISTSPSKASLPVSQEKSTIAISADLDVSVAPIPTNIATILQQFSPFPRLPPELRLKIWKYSIEPRTIVIHNFNPISDPGPGTLHACKESCLATIPGYRFLRQGNNSNDDKLSYWINFQIDYVRYVGSPSPKIPPGFERNISNFLLDLEFKISPWWMNEIERLVLVAEITRHEQDAISSLLSVQPRLQHPIRIWRSLKQACPDLNDVIFVFPTRGQGVAQNDINPIISTPMTRVLLENLGRLRENGMGCRRIEVRLTDRTVGKPQLDLRITDRRGGFSYIGAK